MTDRPVRILVDASDWEDPTDPEDPYSEAFDRGGDLPLSCTCFDPHTCEFGPDYPCSYCRRLEEQELA